MRIARVLVESPVPRLDRLLDYEIPERLESDAIEGVRVKVPLGRGSRLVEGFIVNLAEQTQSGVVLSEIDSVLGKVSVLTPALWALVRAAADRNGGSASDILRLAVPKRAVRVEAGRFIPPRARTEPRPGRKIVVDLPPGVTDTEQGPTLEGFCRIAEIIAETPGGVIVVVPDWRDIALLTRALAKIPHTVWDSTGTPSERYARYLSILSGESRVVIGLRSAVYAPVEDLGALIVVNESDPSLDEPLAPFVHARDAAIIRHGVEGGNLIFASTTPSVELTRFLELDFVTRDSAAVGPSGVVERPHCVLANDAPDDGFAGKARIPASAWRLVRDALTEGPVLVQVARPGFVPSIVCKACRTPHRCVRCRSPLAGSRDGSSLCRVCGNQPVGIVCPRCGGRELALSGAGSVRTADELGRAFPGARVVVSDAEHRQLEIPRGKTLVVATRGAEPVVDGGYGVVLIVDGDRELQRPGLRTTENCLRWWGNAASLVARDGTVVLANVEGSFGALFASGQWDSIVDNELRDRRALGFPPASRTIAVSGSVAELATIRQLSQLVGTRILGPAVSGETHRLVVLADYKSAPNVVSAIRSHIVGSGKSTLRIHCDDLTVFDEIDED